MGSRYLVGPTSLKQPATGATGAAVKGLLTGAPSDPAWADEVRALRADLPVAGSPWDA